MISRHALFSTRAARAGDKPRPQCAICHRAGREGRQRRVPAPETGRAIVTASLVAASSARWLSRPELLEETARVVRLAADPLTRHGPEPLRARLRSLSAENVASAGLGRRDRVACATLRGSVTCLASAHRSPRDRDPALVRRRAAAGNRDRRALPAFHVPVRTPDQLADHALASSSGDLRSASTFRPSASAVSPRAACVEQLPPRSPHARRQHQLGSTRGAAASSPRGPDSITAISRRFVSPRSATELTPTASPPRSPRSEIPLAPPPFLPDHADRPRQMQLFLLTVEDPLVGAAQLPDSSDGRSSAWYADVVIARCASTSFSFAVHSCSPPAPRPGTSLTLGATGAARQLRLREGLHPGEIPSTCRLGRRIRAAHRCRAEQASGHACGSWTSRRTSRGRWGSCN